MNKEKMLEIAERNLKKSQMSFYRQFNRPGIKESEKENLANNVEYAMLVRDLIAEKM